MQKPEGIVIIGAGNVATFLATSLRRGQHPIVQVYNRSAEKAQKLAKLTGSSYTVEIEEIDRNAAIYIISVSDDAIIDTISKIGSVEGVVVHTAGSVPLSVFDGFTANYGVIYPMQTFSGFEHDFNQDVPIFVEYNNELSCTIIEQFSGSLSKIVNYADSEKRKILHLGAVFCSNFPNYLYTIAEKLAAKADSDFNVYAPLINKVVNNAIEKGPVLSQTGPARRNDIITITKHLEILSTLMPEFDIYKLLTESIISEYYKK